MLLPHIDVNHFSKASFNFPYAPVVTLCRFSDKLWKASKIFSLFFFQVVRGLPGILNWFATSLLGLPFSISYNALYFTFEVEVTSWCFLFVAIFIASATNNQIEIILKTSKHSNIMAFKLKDEKTRLRNQDSNYMMKNTSRGPKNLFELDEFSNYVSSNLRSFLVWVYY